jgi:hypothetical protein
MTLDNGEKMTLYQISATMIYVMWYEERRCNVTALKRVHLSDLVNILI